MHLSVPELKKIVKDYVKRLRENKTLVNGFFFSVFAFVGRGISFVLLIMLASFIPPVDYGKLSLFNTVVMLMGFFMAFGTNGYFGISFFKEDRNTFHQDFSFILMMLLLSVGLIAIVLLLLGSYLSSLAGVSYELLWWALIVAFTSVPFAMYTDYYRLQEKVGMYGLLNIGNALLNAIFSILLVIKFAQGWMGRVNTHIGVNVLFFVVAMVFFLKKRFLDLHINRERMKMILFWGVPQIPHMATFWIRSGCDQYIINYNYSTQEVGLYSFAFNLVGVITMIGMAFNSSNSVTIYQVLSDKNKTIDEKKEILQINSNLIYKIYLGAAIAVVGCGALFVSFVLPKYSESIPFFLILSVYGFFVCICLLYCNYLFYYGYTRQLMYITFASSILHLCLSLLLTPVSLYLTACVSIKSQSVIFVSYIFLSKRVLRRHLNDI